MLKQPVINAFGGTAKLASALEIKQPAVSLWDTTAPTKRANQISQILPRHHLAVLGGDIIENGYLIVPLAARSKRPKIPNWTTLEVTKEDVYRYSAMEYNGVGILAKNAPAIDIDILDEKIAQYMVSFVRGQFATVSPLQRTGKAPKTLFVFRCIKPFKKKKSKEYRDLEGNKQQIEILADGEQFVAFNIHPDTHKNYTWHDMQSPFNVPMQDLPILTEEFAEAVIKEFERVAPKEWVCTNNVSLSVVETNTKENKASERSIVSFISGDDVARHLSTISPEDYDIWCRVGMAIHHQFKGSEKGFDLWDAWSADALNYDSNVIKSKWNSFKKDNTAKPLTYRTIISLYDVEVQKEYEIEKAQFYQRYIYIKNAESVIDQHILDEQNCIMTRNAFKNAKLHLTREYIDEEGKVNIISVANEWLKSSRKQVVDNLGYKPLDKRIYTEDSAVLYNTFRFPNHRECKGDLSLFYDHINYLFPVESESNWFIDWIAFNIQYPERKSLVSPLHVSPYQGTGRGWLVELLQKLLGPWNTSETDADTLSGHGNHGQYNEYLYRKLMCFVEEIRQSEGKHHALMEKLKSYTTSTTQNINVKYSVKGTFQCYTNFFFMSNHMDAIKLREEDRRFNVFHCTADPRSREYYTKLYQWSENHHNVAALFYMLKTRNIKDFDYQRAKENEARRQMIDNAKNDLDVAVDSMIKEPPFAVMTHGQIFEYLNRQNEDLEIDKNHLRAILRNRPSLRNLRPVKIIGNMGISKTVRPRAFDAKISKQATEEIKDELMKAKLQLGVV